MSDLICPFCQRQRPLTFHHLIPRSCHSNKWFRKRFSREEMNQGIDICRQCHTHIHKQYNEKELGRFFNSAEKLLDDPELQKFFQWARKQQ